jgi:hypothetical protein
MIRWAPPTLADLASDLVPEPDARPALLSRFAVPARGPWFWASLWVLVIVAEFVALIPVLWPDGPVVRRLRPDRVAPPTR